MAILLSTWDLNKAYWLKIDHAKRYWSFNSRKVHNRGPKFIAKCLGTIIENIQYFSLAIILHTWA
jgi:hypothetical protein